MRLHEQAPLVLDAGTGREHRLELERADDRCDGVEVAHVVERGEERASEAREDFRVDTLPPGLGVAPLPPEPRDVLDDVAGRRGLCGGRCARRPARPLFEEQERRTDHAAEVLVPTLFSTVRNQFAS